MEYLPITAGEPAFVSALTAEPAGIWINETNGQSRLALTRDGSYSKTLGLRQSAYSGRYSCQGARIRFIDDFDFVVTGEIHGNVLRIGDYTYRRAA